MTLCSVPPPPPGASVALRRIFEAHKLCHQSANPDLFEQEIAVLWSGLNARDRIDYAALCRCPLLENYDSVVEYLKRSLGSPAR